MSTYTDKFSTEFLSEEQMREAMFSLPNVFQELLGTCRVVASYGWSCNLHVDLCYKPMDVGTSWMEYFIEDSVEHRIVVPGHSDFRFVVPENRLDLMFCHESDIHLNGSDDELLRCFMSAEPFARFRWLTCDEARASLKSQDNNQE